jgi:AcrR family transcriptional regulator
VARQNGIAGLTLREVALRVGMQPPSLYSHFESKNAIYDAMFAQGWQQAIDHFAVAGARLPADPRRRLEYIATTFFEFATADSARYLLLNVRVLPDFTPSAEAYAVAVECFGQLRRALRSIGITRNGDLDVFTSLLTGLVSQQQANEPGGTRWRRLVPRVMQMYADQLGLPERSTQGRKR